MVEQAGTFNRTVVDFLDEVVARGPHLAASA
jgi:hypothetical protein